MKIAEPGAHGFTLHKRSTPKATVPPRRPAASRPHCGVTSCMSGPASALREQWRVYRVFALWLTVWRGVKLIAHAIAPMKKLRRNVFAGERFGRAHVHGHI